MCNIPSFPAGTECGAHTPQRSDEGAHWSPCWSHLDDDCEASRGQTSRRTTPCVQTPICRKLLAHWNSWPQLAFAELVEKKRHKWGIGRDIPGLSGMWMMKTQHQMTTWGYISDLHTFLNITLYLLEGSHLIHLCIIHIAFTTGPIFGLGTYKITWYFPYQLSSNFPFRISSITC